jgi:predicted LPLAT superfamily acyltransferase
MNQQWTRQAERGSPAMLNLIRWIALHLGRNTARLILHPITLYFLLFAPSPRLASRNYLLRISTHPVRIWHIAKHFHHFSATILDRVFFLTGDFSKLDIKVHGLEIIDKQINSGSGCIMLGSHIGSFEILRALAITKHNIPVKVIMQETHNEMITRILNLLNPDIADSVIQLGEPDSLLKVHEYIQQGYMIGILGDRAVASDRTTTCEVIGEQAVLPTGPLFVASKLRVPVILFFGRYNGGNSYEIFFEEFADTIMVRPKQADADLNQWVQKYADRLTYHARQSPYNWFNFYDFWDNNA